MNKKNAFFTFCVSLLPGAGEMYMGLYKQGISLMTAFFAFGIIGGWAYVPIFFLPVPVIWAYSFFHVHNLRAKSEEEFAQVKDSYLFFDGVTQESVENFVTKNKKWIGILMAVFGGCMLIDMITDILYSVLPIYDWFGHYFNIMHYAPNLIFACVLIFVGVKVSRAVTEHMEEVSGNEDLVEE